MGDPRLPRRSVVTPRVRAARGAGALAFALFTAVTGTTAAATPGGPVCDAAASPALPPSPLRRLTFVEYDNTIRDLLGDDSGPAKSFPEEGGSGFDNNAHLSVASRLHAEKYMGAAEGLAARATKDLPALLGCDPRRGGERPCVAGFVARFGRRAYRRPLEPAESDALLATYARARRGRDVRGAVRIVLQAMLQSPHFLYRVETGRVEPGAPAGALTDFEIASRLSYFLWATMPDEALFEAAAAGRLRTRAEVEAQARRMLDDPRAKETVQRFFGQWLELLLLGSVQRERKHYPLFSSEIGKLMKQEFERFVEHAVFETKGTVETLLASPVTFVNGRLAAYYGIPGVQGEELVRVEADPRRRAGILTMGAFVTMHAKENATFPIKRGALIREQLLCQIPPPPPDDVSTELPPPSAELVTLRERMEEHRNDLGCAKCHRLFDPLGLALENYDAVGRWRDADNGRPVDATGELVETDVDGPFTDAVDLARRLGRSAQVRGCFVKQWFRFAYGRTESAADACTLADLERRFARGGYAIRELLVALTQTDAFLSRGGAVLSLGGETR